MKFQRGFAMPNKHTFLIKPIKAFVMKYYSSNKIWIDPFCGYHSPVSYKWRNDLNPDIPAKYHLEARDFLKIWGDYEVDGIIYDPPYSLRQLKECYDSIGLEKLSIEQSQLFTSKYYTDELYRILRPGGIILKFGWNSNRFNDHFRLEELLLVNHGGGHYDTLCTVQRKIQQNLMIVSK